MSNLDKQAGNKKIQLKVCLNDQVTIAWFTSTRGVYEVSLFSLWALIMTEDSSLHAMCKL